MKTDEVCNAMRRKQEEGCDANKEANRTWSYIMPIRKMCYDNFLFVL